MTRLDRPIFVVGCPRSGTTLVQCILSASSGAFSLPETHFFSHVLPAIGALPETPIGRQEIRDARDAFDTEAELTLPASFWSAFEDVAQRELRTALDVFLAVVEHFRPAPGLRVIEKTPRHVLHLDTIARAFPDAVFIEVVRDPIDVASSLLGVPFETSRSMLSYAQRWTESIQAARAFARTLPGRLRTVIYEQLVREPETAVRELCTFVDLPYELAMLEEFGREAARNVGRGEAWKGDVKSGVIIDRQGVWRVRMTPGQAWLVAQATTWLRGDFGYLDRPAASATSIVRAVVKEARVRFREARSSNGVVGAARHAGSVLKTLAAA
ncbi:MAG TPA: sulfotransferase [Chloroflexota bacterium]|nr:sulfotransferase [Chloroflexota bacterium]